MNRDPLGLCFHRRSHGRGANWFELEEGEDGTSGELKRCQPDMDSCYLDPANRQSKNCAEDRSSFDATDVGTCYIQASSQARYRGPLPIGTSLGTRLQVRLNVPDGAIAP